MFVLYLPTTYTPPRSARKALSSGEGPINLVAAASGSNGTATGTSHAAPADPPAVSEPQFEAETEDLRNEVGDDRDDLRPGDRVILIVENDLGFARFLLDAARHKGFKGLVTTFGAPALTLAREFKPDAMTLDIHLPDIAGWRVLDRLKNDVSLRHIPICVISTDDARDRALASGALAFLAKPIQNSDLLDDVLDDLREFIGRSTRTLVVVESDPVARNRILDCIDVEDLRINAATDMAAARQMLQEQRVDCVVLRQADGGPIDDLIAGIDERPSGNGRLPVVVFGDDDHRENAAWKRLSEVCTLRRAHSPERLLDLTTFFLHRAVAKLPEAKRQLLVDLHQSDKPLSGKHVLIVDDDIRNIFALSAVLEEHEMVILSADNGRDAIRILRETPGIDIVLMDIMMPEMDGLETMRAIRQIPALRNLPIVAVTAKAMKGDREKCIEAGAWDYLSKPVNAEQMLSVLRAWLHR
jgi:CheY-like chemotaxis protein